MTEGVEVIEAQPDWLTATCTDTDRLPVFRAWARRVVDLERLRPNKEKPFTAFGYEGTAAGRARWGARADSDMVQLSGDVAAMELTRALERSTHVSRLDLAVTVRLTPERTDVEAVHYAAYRDAPRREGARAGASLIQSTDGGSTFYLGKRTSDVFLRIYNKAVESDEERYARCHRYELEVKGVRASITATQADGAPSMADFTQSTVFHWCADHGIIPPFGPRGDQHIIRGFRRRSDEETKLSWLERSVRPTVDWLREFGDQARVLDALGYDPAEVGRLLGDGNAGELALTAEGGTL